MGTRKIEICAGSVADVIAARKGGAIRVELCSALDLGGVTPSSGLMTGAIREKGGMRIHVLIRPRPGNFVYTPLEIAVMEADIAAARAAGADGIAIGALTEQGDIDIQAMHRFMTAAQGMDVTFHRAFDECADPVKMLDTLVQLGVSRVLTSGGKTGAFQGMPLLKQLVAQSRGKITIMPGAGINPLNISNIERFTKATEFHSTATDKAIVRPSSKLFGTMPAMTDVDIVRQLVNK